jgi:hypothetical protein
MKSATKFALAATLISAIAIGAPSRAETPPAPDPQAMRLISEPASATLDLPPSEPSRNPAVPPAKDAAPTENPPAHDSGLSGDLQPNPRALLILRALLNSGRYSCCR